MAPTEYEFGEWGFYWGCWRDLVFVWECNGGPWRLVWVEPAWH